MGALSESPTTFANFCVEAIYTAPPRSWAERAYRIARWTDYPQGGHFAAVEEPEALVADLQAWGRETG